MNKRYAYNGAIAQDQDVLRTNLFAEIALGKALHTLIGTAPAVRGFAVTPTSPASLAVVIGIGEIYTLASLLPAAYGSIPQDISSEHQIVKQGVHMDPVARSTPAPATSGHSINYLIQVAFVESDADPTVLQYWNSANPSNPLTGPGGNGAAQPLTRSCGVAISAKAGTSATTGTQTTPSADAGYIGVAVVTVANGATTVTGGNISAYPGAPFLATGAAVRPVLAANLTANQTGVVSATQTKIAFNEATSDTHKFFNTSTNRYTPLVAGTYQVTAGVEFNSGSVTGARVSVWVNGALVKAGPVGTYTSAVTALMGSNGATDYFEAYAYHTTGSNQVILANAASTWLQVIRVA